MPDAPTIHEIYELGSQVRIGPVANGIEAMVQSVTLCMDGVIRYSVTWWNGKSRTEANVSAAEITGPAGATVKIGFSSRQQANSNVDSLDIGTFRADCQRCGQKIKVGSTIDGRILWMHVSFTKPCNEACPPGWCSTAQQIKAVMAESSQQNPKNP